MKVNKIIFASGILLLVLISGACNLSQPREVETDENTTDTTSETATPAPVPPTEEIQPTATQEEVIPEPSSKRYTFDQLGISLEVPSELYVFKEPGVNYDDPSKLDGYYFYIQNYGYREGPHTGDFQMYGHYQYSLRSLSWDEFANNTINSPNNASVTEIEINGLRGFDTFPSVQRKRFVYQFLLEGQVLTLAVTATTDENKVLADQIIKTLTYDPSKFTDQSHIQKIVEPNFFYGLYLPDDWTYSFGTPAGIRLSDFQASSPDYQVVVEETDGPHSNIYYKNGVFLNIVVLEDDSALSEPTSAVIQSSYPIQYYGIEGMDYLFTEPSTSEGVLREIRYFYDGKSFILRFGYAMDVDQELLEWIILNVIITPIPES